MPTIYFMIYTNEVSRNKNFIFGFWLLALGEFLNLNQIEGVSVSPSKISEEILGEKDLVGKISIEQLDVCNQERRMIREGSVIDVDFFYFLDDFFKLYINLFYS